MSSISVSPLLRRVMRIDALFSAAAGILLVGGHQALVAPLGLPEPLMLGAGLFMVPYVLLLAMLSRRSQLHPGLVWMLIVGNAAWALESIGILALGWIQPTGLGQAFVIFQAVVVGLFAELQWWALRRASASQPAFRGLAA